MSSLSYEQREKLYHQIASHSAVAPVSKLVGVQRAMVEIGQRLASDFPALALLENKYALLMAVELRFDELKNEILRDEDARIQLEFYIEDMEGRTCAKLMELGILPCPF
jgi:hypothetical protein